MCPALDDRFTEDAVCLAKKWQDRANVLLDPAEKRRTQQLARLVANADDKIILTALIDQGFRSRNARRVADQIHHLLSAHGIPRFFSFSEKALIQLFLRFGRFLPSTTVPRIIAKMRADSRHAVIAGEHAALGAYLQERRTEGLRVNVNHLGEEVLGEKEALTHMDTYLADLRDPRIEGIAVKISTICAQIHPLAFAETVDRISERLSILYREAAAQTYSRPDGTRVPKSVTLDMEAYRDLALTAAAFMRTLDLPEFRNVFAGMALQAYLPDSFGMLQEITAWAKRRVDAGGSPVKVRIVKGANMEMELLESSLYGWPLAPYDNKLDVDANWKRMVSYGLEPDHARAVRLGVASHNLFDVAFAYQLARRNQVTDFFTFEMIEGMANHVRRAVRETGQDLLAYAPVAEDRHFINAVAYLIRRLDENTGPRNFLRHLHRLQTGTSSWQMLADHFRASVRRIPTVGSHPHRAQNRITETVPTGRGTYATGEFRNEPNTDWSLAANRAWAEGIRRAWMKGPGDKPLEVPVVAAGKDLQRGRKVLKACDPNQLPATVVVARCALATAGDAKRAVAAAKADPDGWRTMTFRRRHRILCAAADEIRRARGDLIGAAAASTGKLFTEADPEVSEAVDFAEFYPHAARAYFEMKNLRCRGKGVGLVIAPWNFPIAIPCGGIAAALSAGNTVIFKPSSDAILVGWLLCQCFWRAGVSKNTLQFLPCAGGSAGAQLASHPDVDFVILTGGTETGLKILRARPDLPLTAETGGKNATVVTAMSDRDQAIADVVYSAFGNSGQKCSATSLLILEREIYDDEKFPPPARGRRRHVHGRLGLGLHRQDGPPHPAAAQPPPGSALRSDARRIMGARAETDRRQSAPVVAGHQVGRAAGQPDPPDRVLRPAAGGDARGEPETGRRPGEPDRLRPHLGDREPRPPRAGVLAGAGPGREPLHQPRHDRRQRPAPALRRHGQIGSRRRHQGRRPALRDPVPGGGGRGGPVDRAADAPAAPAAPCPALAAWAGGGKIRR